MRGGLGFQNLSENWNHKSFTFLQIILLPFFALEDATIWVLKRCLPDIFYCQITRFYEGTIKSYDPIKKKHVVCSSLFLFVSSMHACMHQMKDGFLYFNWQNFFWLFTGVSFLFFVSFSLNIFLQLNVDIIWWRRHWSASFGQRTLGAYWQEWQEGRVYFPFSFPFFSHCQ